MLDDFFTKFTLNIGLRLNKRNLIGRTHARHVTQSIFQMGQNSNKMIKILLFLKIGLNLNFTNFVLTYKYHQNLPWQELYKHHCSFRHAHKFPGFYPRLNLYLHLQFVSKVSNFLLYTFYNRISCWDFCEDAFLVTYRSSLNYITLCAKTKSIK